MVAQELIAYAIPSLHSTDTIQRALDRMAEFKVRHMPVVNEDQFIGLVAEDDLIAPDHQLALKDIQVSLLTSYVFEDQHIYEVIRIFYESKATLVPVLSLSKAYLGVITVNELSNAFAELTSASDPGGIIVLEMSNKENSMSHIAQIIESDNAHILSSYTRTFPDSTRNEVTLKLNKQDLSGISASFLRYGYDVKAVFGGNDGNDDSMDRYDSLMNYLNL
ncbi:CBS domain-containing protein [Mucilaginibacter sp. RS28]|uniref:CBS domain-containing protein n=1 Tax=Mucilaginibacter straminoryzae TaxID=2932774 RepID=A0A9X2B966_9SPHI|nr:CBS domain-containing protein [Mucilaginibacter straminoryzae]MCJ8210151.1 CBS domain-containing protein [Mucilaginibacter straminoryzae]